MGPDGPLYDTRSPEWRMSGGDIYAYQELMQQKMMMQQQKYLMQQMQKAAQLQKNQANGKGKGKGKTNAGTNANAFGQPGSSNFSSTGASGFYDPYAEPVNHYRRKTYKHGPSSATTKSKSEDTKKTP